MTQRLSSRDRALLERYLDGETTPDESAECEGRLRTDDVFRSLYDELKRLSELLGSADRLEKDPAFWSRMSGKIRQQEDQNVNLLPFPQKYLPLAASGFALLVLLSFSYVFENRLSFLRFWEMQSEVVRTAYEKSVQEGSFIPLFTGLDNDKTLQFALYGSLPLDESAGAMLNVDERSAEGYRIEVHKQQPRKQKKVTVADFVAEVRPTNVQKAAIESLLTDARRELERSVLIGQGESVAINADLSKLNRAMASGIVSVLEPEQRLRLTRLLTQDDAAYIFSSRTRYAPPTAASASLEDVPRTTNRFVVLSPETVMIRALTVDMDRVQREMKASQTLFREYQAQRHKMIQWLVNEPVFRTTAPVPGAPAPRISLKSRKDRLTIQFNADTSEAGMYFHVDDATGGVYVQGGDSVQQFEFRVESNVPVTGSTPALPKVRAEKALRPDTAKPRRPFKLDID